MFGRDRDFSKTANKPPYFESGATGQGNIQGPWATGVPVANQSADYLGGSGSGYGNPLATPTNNCGQINMALAPSLSAGGQPFCNFDTGPFVGLLGETETTSLTGNFVFRLNDKAELFADGPLGQSDCQRNLPAQSAAHQLPGNRRGIRQSRYRSGPAAATDQPELSDRCRLLERQWARRFLSAQDLGITARVFDFGPRAEENESTQMRIVGGVRGDFMEQSYNIALTYNENKLDGKVTDGYFSQVGFAKATQAPGSDWNPWSLTQSPGIQGCHCPGQVRGWDAQRQVHQYGRRCNACRRRAFNCLPA